MDRVVFDYDDRRWKSCRYKLPFHRGDYVLLTPNEILTRDEAWINQTDMLAQFTQLRTALPDEQLLAMVNEHFVQQINQRSTEVERRAAALRTITKFTELLDYYIKGKEEHAAEAHDLSDHKVQQTRTQFIENVRELVQGPLWTSGFYEAGDSYEESLRRVQYLKHVIEDNDGHRVFYVDGEPVKRESDLHVMFRLTWCATTFDLNSEVNNGRGPVDFKVSRGKRNANLVEFKLASNTSLKRNLQNQVGIYEKASQTERSIKVILYFSDSELDRVNRILKELKLEGQANIVLIDASRESKISGSKA